LTISPFLFEAQIINDRKKLQVASLQMPQMWTSEISNNINLWQHT
jgi:hypothetical protein